MTKEQQIKKSRLKQFFQYKVRSNRDTYAIEALRLENVTVHSVQFSPSSSASAIYAPCGNEERRQREKLSKEYEIE